MTQEEKELLLKDLCARLPYGIKVCYRISNKDNPIIETLSGHMLDYFNENSIVEVKPYLRSLSSMTEEEENEYQDIVQNDGNWVNLLSQNLMNFFNKHHFDYRGLIEKGLAIEAPEGMYDIKTE